MSVEYNLHPVELPINALVGSADFERGRKEIYKTTQQGVAERANRLTELAGTMVTHQHHADSGEPVSVLDLALDKLTASETLTSPPGSRYRLVLDGQGRIVDIARIVQLEEDARTVEALRRQMENVPWAPKQNTTSFRRSDAPLRKFRSQPKRAKALQG